MNWGRHVVAMELRKIIAYRTDFWITFLGQTAIQLVVASALWQAIFEAQNVKEMQGFSLEMMQLYYLIAPIGMKIITGENFGFISREIYEGTFTRYLLYPLSVFHYKTFTYLSHSLFYAVQLILLYLMYRLVVGSDHLDLQDLSNLLLGTGLFFLGAMAYLMMGMLVELLALWAENIWSVGVMLRFFTSFLGGAFIPLTFLPQWSQKLLEWTPFPYLVSIPARTIMGLTTWDEIVRAVIITSIWILVFRGLVRVFWTKGEKKYTGVGI